MQTKNDQFLTYPPQRQSEQKPKPVKQDPMVPHNMKGKDIIR